MSWNSHSHLEGKHSRLSASKPQWLDYDDDKFVRVYEAELAKRRGVALHNLADNLIKLGVPLPDTTATLNAYVNDAIRFKMRSEQILFYSFNAFVCADAIGHDIKRRILRVHDLKTGDHAPDPRQLETYASYYCLEYKVNPFDLDQINLRFYQHDGIDQFDADPATIVFGMEKIKHLDRLITEIEAEVMG